jgi:hypothetical protein
MSCYRVKKSQLLEKKAYKKPTGCPRPPSLINLQKMSKERLEHHALSRNQRDATGGEHCSMTSQI